MHVLAHLLLTCTVFFYIHGLQRWRLFAVKHLIQDKTEKQNKKKMCHDGNERRKSFVDTELKP